MTSKPNFRLDAENVRAYLADVGLILPAREIIVRELGGGVSNIVLLVERPAASGRRWVVKQSLGKLRVKDDWRSDRERIFREAESIQDLHPEFPHSSLPEVIHIDRQNFLFIMTAAPAGAATWKDLLLDGKVDLSVAAVAGRFQACMIVASRRNRDFQKRFEDQAVFDQLRIDPYYRTTAERCPDMAPAIRSLIEDSCQIRTALVHGDYSPKNILVHPGGIFVIDFEAVHWGDPAFDSGFLLNHLLLKAIYQRQYAKLYLEAAGEFWNALVKGVGSTDETGFEWMTVRHLGALMLARIDGKSPVEYIQNEETKGQVRRLAKRILLERPPHLSTIFHWVTEGSSA